MKYINNIPCPIISFAPLQEAIAIQEKENKMSYYDDDPVSCLKKTAKTQAVNVDVNLSAVQQPSTEQRERDYLLGRLNNVAWEKENLLDSHFEDFPKPATLKEMKERLKKGEYTIESHGHTDDHKIYPHINSFLSWRTKPYDKEGHEKAREKFNTLKIETEDQIRLFDSKTGLEALQKFEKAKFH